MRRLFLAGLLVVGIPGSALAQRESASVAGAVRDPSGAPVPGASVAVRNLATGVERTVLSNEVGYYVVTALPPGRYSLTVTQQGFATFGVPELVLQVDQQATVNVALELGQVSETRHPRP